MPVSAINYLPWAQQGALAGQAVLSTNSTKTRAMIKTLEVITEAIRNPNHPFRKADSQPKKSMKHRYERRKIKEYLHLADWQEEQAT
jgi:hypothetical protein